MRDRLDLFLCWLQDAGEVALDASIALFAILILCVLSGATIAFVLAFAAFIFQGLFL